MRIGWYIKDNFKGVTPRYVEQSSTIVLNQKCIRNGVLDFSESKYISDEQTITPKKYIKEGDILICSTGQGSAGRCAYVSKLPDTHKVTIDSHILVCRCDDNTLAAAIAHIIFSLESLVMKFLTGSSGQAELDKVRLFNIDIALTKDRQLKRTISFLQKIDAKISLNYQIKHELEVMAKEFYDYWFMQFDFPNENGHPYKSSGGKMRYNGRLKRKIPIRWTVTTIEKIIKTALGGTPDTENDAYWNGNINWLSSGEMANFPVVRSKTKITKEGLKNSATKLMPKGTVATSITRYIRPTILAIDACANQSVVGLLENEVFRKEYMYPYLQNQVAQYLMVRTGAQQPHINKGTIDKSLIIVPPVPVLNAYYEYASPIYQRIIMTAQESDRLIALRDELLPLLMNGQGTVSDTNNMVSIKKLDCYEQKFDLWLQNQGIAARGNINQQTLREIFDVMDDDDK